MRVESLIVVAGLVACGARATTPGRPAHTLAWTGSETLDIDQVWALELWSNQFRRSTAWRRVAATPRKVPATHALGTGVCDAERRCAWTTDNSVCVSRPEERAVESCWDLPADPRAVESEHLKIAAQLFAKDRTIFWLGDDGTCEAWDYTRGNDHGGELVHVYVVDGKRARWTYGFDFSGEGVGISGPSRKPLDGVTPALTSGCLNTYFFEQLDADRIVLSSNKPGERAHWYLSSAGCEAARREHDRPQLVGCR